VSEKEKEKEYTTPIAALSDFNIHARVLAIQSSALNAAVYSPALDRTATMLIDEYHAFSPIAKMLPGLDASVHSPAAIFARDANLAISSLATSESVLGLATIRNEIY